MKTILNWNTRTTTVIVLLFATTVLFAQKPEMKREGAERDGSRKIEKLFERIPSLTDDQKVQIKSIHSQAQEQVKPLRDQLRVKREALKTLSDEGPEDLTEANQLIEEIGAMKIEMEKHKLVTKMEVRKVLTEDQRNQLEQARNERKGSGKWHKGAE